MCIYCCGPGQCAAVGVLGTFVAAICICSKVIVQLTRLKGWSVWSAALGVEFTGDPTSLARYNIYVLGGGGVLIRKVYAPARMASQNPYPH